MKDFDLTSQKWMNLVFEGKNTQYGAYVLREESSDRHLKSLIIVLLVGLSLIFLPGIIKNFIPEESMGGDKAVTAAPDYKLENINLQLPEENIIKTVVNIPPPVLKKSIKHTIPIVVTDAEVPEESLMATQNELNNTDAAIASVTVKNGVTEGGVLIDDVLDRQVPVYVEPVEIRTFVDQMPQFGIGEKDLMDWLSKNINYPSAAVERGIQGTVNVRFVVNADGSVSNVEVLYPIDPSLDKEAIRVINSMPKWMPGKQNGVAVPVWYNLPVRFQLT